MSKIKFENGQVVNFEGTPTTQDVEEVARKLGINQTSQQITQPLNTQVPDQGIKKVGGALDFLVGGGKIGQFLGQKAFKAFGGTSLGKAISGVDLTQEQARQSTVQGPTGAQLLGDVGRVGLNFLPGAKALQATKLGGKLAVGAGLGAGFTVAEDIRQGRQISPLNTLVGAGAGAVLPPAIGYVGKKLAQGVDASARALVNLTFNRTGKALQKDIRLGDIGFPGFADKYLEGGKWWSSAKVARTDLANKVLPDLGNKYQQFGESSVGGRLIPINDVKNSFNRVGTALRGYLGPENELVQTLENVHTSNLSVRKAIELKAVVNSKVLPANFRNDVKLSALNDELGRAMGKVTQRLHNKLGDVVLDDAGNVISKSAGQGISFKDLDKTYGIFKVAYDGLVSKASKKVFSLGNLTKAGIVGGVGLTAGGVPGAAVALGAEKAASSLPVRLGTAFALKKGERIISHEATQKIGKQTFFNILSKF